MSNNEADFTKIGTKVDELEVVISYKIIDLFSGHLYSSPLKAIEELVVNSYDAFADNCRIFIPDLKKDKNKIIVFDDGEGMDKEGLEELWMIAETKKRLTNREEAAIKKGRIPIGKFGIGKLASYVIGHRITHITKKSNRILSVCMDYSFLNDTTEHIRYKLDVIELNKNEVNKIYEYIFKEMKYKLNSDLNKLKNWTLVVIDELKPKAKEISIARLKWIISTALPLVPDFQCYINNKLVVSSKEDVPLLKTWTIGKDDEVAKSLGYETEYDDKIDDVSSFKVEIPDIGSIWGVFELYKNSITFGKSQAVGRSNGFFIMVRGRLINSEKPYFNLPVLSHSTFNRFRAVIHANGLDKYLVVNREGVYDIGHQYLETYLSKKFNEVRNFYTKITTEKDRDQEYTEKYEELPSSLVKYPIRHAVERIKQEELKPFIIESFGPEDEIQEVVTDVELVELDPNEPIAKLDLQKGIIQANTAHPFRNNFEDEESYTSWAIAEALLEVYMLEAGIDYHIVQ